MNTLKDIHASGSKAAGIRRVARYRLLAALILFCLAMASYVAAPDGSRAAEGGEKAAQAVAEEIKAAIVRRDSGWLARHLPDGLYFVDAPYAKNELLALFKQKDNWLNRNLFTGKESLAHYFATAKDQSIAVHRAGGEIMLVYRSSGYQPHEWPWCSISFHDGGWRFGDFFAHR